MTQLTLAATPINARGLLRRAIAAETEEELTEFYEIDATGKRELRMDKTVEYSNGTDERGEYLTIGNIPGWTEYGENRPNMKWRRV